MKKWTAGHLPELTGNAPMKGIDAEPAVLTWAL